MGAAPPVERVAQLDVCAVDVALADLASATLVRDLINVFAGERNVVFGGYDQALDVSDADKGSSAQVMRRVDGLV